MKTTIPALVLVMISCIIFFSLALEKKAIVNPGDYKTALATFYDGIHDSELNFWAKKLDNDPNCTPCKLKLASELSAQFKESFEIQYLLEADSLLKSELDSKLGLTSIYQALSVNAISQHKFPEAKEYALKALELGEKKDRSYFLLFDAAMELGDFYNAVLYLKKHDNKSTFNYLIRASKLEDKYGNLNKAIELMEQAAKKVDHDPKLYSWSLSNLADMYGHAGRVEKSYASYLKVLEIDPSHSHSQKGLAWIAYSNDGNTEAAKGIINKLMTRTKNPQLLLELAEIAEYEGDSLKCQLLKRKYYAEVSRPEYGNMYNKYLILLDAEKLETTNRAIQRAKAELKLRRTPEVYDLLAWSLLKNRQINEALKVATENVVGNSEEPEVLYHLGMIFKANQMHKEGNSYLRQALESSFELGPLMSHEIEQTLSQQN